MISEYFSLFKTLRETDKILKEMKDSGTHPKSREANGGNSDNRVKNDLLTVEQVRQNMNEVYQNFDINNNDEKNHSSCFIMAVLHASGLVNNNIICRFIPMQQDKEIIYSISNFLSNGGMDQSMEKFLSKLSKSEMKKAFKVVNWEIEYISENISATVKADIKERFSMMFMI